MQKIIERFFIILIGLSLVVFLIFPLYENSYKKIESSKVSMLAEKNCMLIDRAIKISFSNKSIVIAFLDFVGGFKIEQQENKLIVSVISSGEKTFSRVLEYNFNIQFVANIVFI